MLSIGIVLYDKNKNDYEKLFKSIDIGIKILHKTFPSLDVNILIKKSSDVDLSEMESSVFISKDCTNRGFGRSHNELMKEAFFNRNADLYFALNHDTIIDPYCSLVSYRFYIDNKKSTLFEAMQTPIEHPKPYDPLSGTTQWCSGAALFISKDIYLKTNGFDENMFMYCEDVDLSWRVRCYGGVCKIIPLARVYHDVDARGVKPKEIRRHMLESARYLGYKWSAYEFQVAIEKMLVDEGYYPSLIYIPKLNKAHKEEKASEITEFRQLLSFCLPRW